MTTVINIKDYKEKDYIYCGRGSIFANPFEIDRDGNRGVVIEKFDKWFKFLLKDKKFLLELEKLRGKKLGCYCLPQACHCNIIANYLNNTKPLVTKINLGIIGSRGFNDKDWVFRVLDKNREKIKCIVSGGCKNSADQLSHLWCQKTGVPILIYYAAWHDTEDGLVNRSAGFKRSYYIVNASDQIICFWNMASKGTANSIQIAKDLGKPIKIIDITKPH